MEHLCNIQSSSVLWNDSRNFLCIDELGDTHLDETAIAQITHVVAPQPCPLTVGGPVMCPEGFTLLASANEEAVARKRVRADAGIVESACEPQPKFLRVADKMRRWLARAQPSQAQPMGQSESAG